MKSTINVSLGGIVFHIEDDAHQKLSSYLDAISASLSNSEGHDEIMADIEARIAEILQPKISDYKQVITLADVNEVISTMGSPEEFSAGGTETKQEQTYTAPGRGHAQYGRRRIFRDPDDKVFAGVCSGLAYHFGLDPIWIRFGFGLSIFLGGFGVIVYVLLWMIMPPAQTAAEKLEMRGEPVDINNIRKIIEDDMRDFKKKAKDFGDEMKNWKAGQRTKSFGQNVGDFFASLGHGLGNLIGGIAKGIFAFIGFILVIVFTCLLVALVVSLWSGMNIVHIQTHSGHWVNYSMHSIFTMFAIQGAARTLILTGIFLFIGVPLIALIIRMGRAIIGLRQSPHWFRLTIFLAWFAGLLLLLFGAMSAIGHFSVTGRTNSQITFNTPPAATALYVQMPMENTDGDVFIHSDSLNFYISGDNLFEGNPSLCINASPDSSFHLVLNKSGRGISNAEATDAANNIEYSFAQHDSILHLDPFYKLADGTPWRKQKLDLILEVPQNKTIAMPEGIDNIMCSTVHRQHNHLGGHKWAMTQSGLAEVK